MSGNQAAGVPPTGGSNALAPGIVACETGPAAALGAAAAGGGDESSEEESAPASPAAPVAQPRMIIAASPGMEEGQEVFESRRLEDSGTRIMHGTTPVRGGRGEDPDAFSPGRWE